MKKRCNVPTFCGIFFYFGHRGNSRMKKNDYRILSN